MLKQFWSSISYAGISRQDQSFNSRRQIIFNQLIFLAITTFIIRLMVLVFSGARDFSAAGFACNLLPIIVCTIIFWLNTINKYSISKLLSFYVLPVTYWLVSFTQQDYSMDSFFAIFGMLAFFFLESNLKVIASYLLCAVCFFTLKLVEFHIHAGQSLASELALLIFNNVLVVIVLFMVLSFIRRVVFSYQQQITERTDQLQSHNRALTLSHLEIMEKNALLEDRQASLTQAGRHNNKVFSVISHDLRTPIISVKNILDLHDKGLLTDEGILGYMPELNREMAGVIDLLENMLHWARLNKNGETPQQETVPVYPLINEMINLYGLTARNKNIQLVNQAAASCTIVADRNMVKAIMRNLVSNAIKFTGEGGSVFFTSSVTPTEVSISIRDSGRGLQPEEVQRIMEGSEFTTYGTAGEPGSGLGLSLCRDFLKRNNGRLQISSTPGQGSVFSMILPVPQPAARPTAIEDDAQVLRVMKIA